MATGVLVFVVRRRHIEVGQRRAYTASSTHGPQKIRIHPASPPLAGHISRCIRSQFADWRITTCDHALHTAHPRTTVSKARVGGMQCRLACALPRFDHRLGGRGLAAGAVHPRPNNALRWLGYQMLSVVRGCCQRSIPITQEPDADGWRQ